MVRHLGIDFARYPREHPAYRRLQLLRYYNITKVLDVGANTGQYATELRSMGYENDIVSFEPLSSAYSKLALTAARDPRWRTVKTALGNGDGVATINVSQNTVSSSMLPMLDRHVEAAPASSYVATEEVPIAKLDTVAPQHISTDDKVYLKIDAQGFTRQVLEGADRIIQTIIGCQLELSLVPVYDGDFLVHDALAHMVRRGFTLMGVEPGFFDPDSGQTLQIDALFYRN